MRGNKWLNGIVQIALILLASLLVIGATWQIGQGASAQQTFERGGENDGDRHERPNFDERGGNSHQAEWFSARGIAGFGETVIKMVVVITAIVLGQRAWETYQARRSRKEST